MPRWFDDVLHRALASEVRRDILLGLAKRDKYLTELAAELKKAPQTIDFHLNLLAEIGLVDSKTSEGKKYYSLKDRRVLEFLERGQALPPELRHKPPHEIMLDAWKDLSERLERVERKLDELVKESR